MRRVVSLWFPRLSTDRIWRERRLRNSNYFSTENQKLPPLATFNKIGGVMRLVALDVRATEAGLRPGMSVVDAKALVSNLNIVPVDLSSDKHTLLKISNWCRRYTPSISFDVEIWLDISGCAHLYGCELGLLSDLKKRL